MLDPKQKVAIYAEANMGLINAKTAEGFIRYGRNPIACVIDSQAVGKSMLELCKVDADIPVVATLGEAVELGAEVLVLGTTPPGGRVPPDWINVLQNAVDVGLSIVNGLHDRLNDVFGDRVKPGCWIWDIRTPVSDMPPIASAQAAGLSNTRVLMVGTDMAVGKKTSGLEIYAALRKAGHDAAFLATGQSGVAITGTGIPLDAFRVDHAAGAVERMVMENAEHDILIVEGQGSLLHSGSTATLPLMRGSCCNAMILVHRPGMDKVDTPGGASIPPLRDVIALNEMTASANGALTKAKVIGIALNTRDLSPTEADAAIAATQQETGLPVTDPVRYGGDVLANAVLGFRP